MDSDMTRTTVLVGKIGPAFNGGEIASHGSASMRIDEFNWFHINRAYTLAVLFESMDGNLAQANEYVFDTGIYTYDNASSFEGALDLHSREV
jgi:hypothetical protein